jgi:hypothetical protein
MNDSEKSSWDNWEKSQIAEWFKKIETEQKATGLGPEDRKRVKEKLTTLKFFKADFDTVSGEPLPLAGNEKESKSPIKKIRSRIRWHKASIKPIVSEKSFEPLELFQFLLPRKVKTKIYEPALNDLKEDFLIKAHKFAERMHVDSPHEYHRKIRFLRFCFRFRSTLMVGECLWEMFGSLARKILMVLVPEGIREGIRRFIGM